MDRSQVTALAARLPVAPLVEGARRLGEVLRRPEVSPGGLLLVGTEDFEPWHLTAHLADEARYAQVPHLEPTLVRWLVPAGAPPHLAVTLERLREACRGQTLLVVSPTTAPEALLERAADARRRGATLLSVDAGDRDLGGLAHERLLVPAQGGAGPEGFDLAQHLVSAAAGDGLPGRHGWRQRLERAVEQWRAPAA